MKLWTWDFSHVTFFKLSRHVKLPAGLHGWHAICMRAEPVLYSASRGACEQWSTVREDFGWRLKASAANTTASTAMKVSGFFSSSETFPEATSSPTHHYNPSCKTTVHTTHHHTGHKSSRVHEEPALEIILLFSNKSLDTCQMACIWDFRCCNPLLTQIAWSLFDFKKETQLWGFSVDASLSTSK